MFSLSKTRRCLHGLALVGMGLLAACSNDGKVAGGTEAESTIALQVQLADGAPAAHARVRVLPVDYLSDGADAAEWSVSDGNGFVEVSAEPGDYAVEIRNVTDSRASGAVVNLTLEANDSRVDTVKLGGLSTIEGFVLLGKNVPVIRIAGLDRYVVPDSTGYFVIDSLPSGDFKVNIADTLEDNSTTVVSAPGDTLYVDCSALESEIKVVKPQETETSEYPGKDWSEHAALLSRIDGYAVGTFGAAGVTDSLGNISEAEGEICIVTTTEDYLIVEDTTDVDSAGVAATKAVIAPGSLRDCAYREGPTWVLFEKSGTYNLQSPLRLKNDKTFDGRGRDVRIAGMGLLTETSSNLIFENITFTAPAITALDTSSRRALSLHNGTHHVWVDHCTFEEYPLVELDVKRGTHNVTVSWSRFENAQTAILFGLAGDIIMDTAQSLTAHHNYFSRLDDDGILSHGGELHAYNNFFDGVGKSGVVCSDSARCMVERNLFNNDMPVTLYRWYNEDGSPVDSTVGFVAMSENLLAAGGEAIDGDARGYKPDYKYSLDLADAELAWRVKEGSGVR